jgi:hypothetical protein
VEMIRIVAYFLIFCSLAERIASGAEIYLAKKDGEVVLYTTMVVSDLQVFQRAIAKKYPFIMAHHVRLGAEALTIAEFRAGRHLTDVFGVTFEWCCARYVKSQAPLPQSFPARGRMSELSWEVNCGSRVLRINYY